MSLQLAAQHMASRGRGPDTQLVHMAPQEVSGLQALAKAHGGSLTINPETGLPEAGFLSSILPMVAGAFLGPAGFGLTAAQAGMAVGAVSALSSKSLEKGLMAGLGAFGGAGLAGSIFGAGDAALAAGTGASAAPVYPPGVAPTSYPTDPSAYDIFKPTSTNFGAFGEAPGAVAGPSGPLSGSAFGEAVSGAGAPAVSQATAATPLETVTQVPYSSGTVAQAGQEAVKNASLTDRLGAGFNAISQEPSTFAKNNFNYLGAALLGPGLAGTEEEESEYVPDTKVSRFRYEPRRVGDNFSPQYVRLAANGGLMGLAEGGAAGMSGDSLQAYKYLMGMENEPVRMVEARTVVPGSTNSAGTPGAASDDKDSSEDEYTYTYDPATQTYKKVLKPKTIAPGVNPLDPLQGSDSGTGGGGGVGGGAVSVGGGYDGSFYSGTPLGSNTAPVVTMGTDTGFGGLPSPAPVETMGTDLGFGDPSLSVPTGEVGTEGGYGAPTGGAPSGGGYTGEVGTEGGYGTPSGGYGTPSGGYGTPSGGYGTPSGGYGTPSGGYGGGSPTGEVGTEGGYGAPSGGYGGGSPTGEVGTEGGYGGGYGGGTESDSSSGGYGDGGDGGTGAASSAAGGDAGVGAGSEGGYGGGEARGGLSPNFRYHMARGGLAALARGGQAMYNLGDYSDGGRLLRGPGDGVSDSIPATIANKRPARLADGEFVVPARIVSELGNGSTEAGARKLYAMMDRIQKARKKSIGKKRVAVNSRSDKHLPA